MDIYGIGQGTGKALYNALKAEGVKPEEFFAVLDKKTININMFLDGLKDGIGNARYIEEMRNK